MICTAVVIPMNLLAIDTSTEACSAALMCGDDINERYEVAPRKHAELILPMVDGLLVEADLRLQDLDALAFGRGPGSFTGVRMASSVTQGLAIGADLPIIPVSSLMALAQGVYRTKGHGHIFTCIDARMGEIYWALFHQRGGIMHALGKETVSSVQAITSVPEHTWFGAGSGWGEYGDELKAINGLTISNSESAHFPHAYDVAILGRVLWQQEKALPAEQALPVYLRDEVAWKKTISSG